MTLIFGYGFFQYHKTRYSGVVYLYIYHTKIVEYRGPDNETAYKGKAVFI